MTTLDGMPAEGPPPRANPARGLALIATALILGIFVLRQGFDTDTDRVVEAAERAEEADENGEAAADEPSGDENDGSGEAEEADEPEEVEPRSPTEITVRIANTTAIGGAAGTLSGAIEQNGYSTIEPTDAADRDRDTSVIVFREGWDAEAVVLASEIAPEGVEVELRELGDEPPLSTDNQPLMGEDVQLLVLMGHDLAG